jgi:hypothetical protein
MTHSGLAALIEMAGGLVKKSPTPDAEVSEEVRDQAVEAVVAAVTETVPTEVVEEEVKSRFEPPEPEFDEDEVGDIAPPLYVVPTPEELDRKRADKKDRFEVTEGDVPASYRQKKFLQSLGRVRIDGQLVPIRLMFDAESDERAQVDADWDKALAHKAISTLLENQQFRHPDGWTVYPNREYLAKLAAKKAGRS